MKNWINLLPWRQQLIAQKNRKFIYKISLFFTALLILGMGISLFHGNLTRQLSEKQQQFYRQQDEFAKLTRQVSQLRRSYEQTEEQNLISSDSVSLFLSWLARLPLNEGELTEFLLQQNSIHLHGYAENQQEFDSIHQYIVQTEWIYESKLTHFSTSAKGLLAFSFAIEWGRNGKASMD
ncbi:hypothetical protein [Basfia succiniciproducens]